jgi:uncharacterized repeat protein (TIGR03803 family)
MKTPLPSLIYRFVVLLLFCFGLNLAYAQPPAFWGMTAEGGAFNAGTIFKMAPDGTGYTVQHSFTLETPGSRPGFGSQMLQLANGKMYGVTEYGGANQNGVLYEYNPATNTYIKLHDFTQATGQRPAGGLALAPNGKLYGLAQVGGTANLGVLFEFDLTTNTYTKKVDFTGANGAFPFACTLYLHTNSKFYGVTNQGGTAGLGLLFEYDPATNTYTKKIDFTGTANGSYPYTTLMITSTGRVFGATGQGGTNNNGTLYEYNPSTNVLTKRRDFSTADGRFPLAALVEANNGRLYGTTGNGGSASGGTLFEFNLATNTFTKKIDFNGTNGEVPYPGLIKAANGNLYGMTNGGGTSGVGTIFEYEVTTNTLTKKLEFFYDPVTGKALNGMAPTSNFTLASNGLLYGTTSQGGSAAGGVIFEYNTSTNSYSKKIDFNYSPAGVYPYGGLVRAANGRFYAMTQIGGANDEGALFEFNPNGNVYTKRHDFSSTSGNYPTGSLAAAPNGKLYGMTPNDGSFNRGTLFEFDPATNTFTKKVDFDYNSNGSEPRGSLLLASNNKFYGMTNSGGQTGDGVLFEYDPATSILTNKIEFEYNTGSEPYGDLTQATNGKLYGMTREGGDNGNASGTLFEYDIATNTMTSRVNFSELNGENPEGNLVQAPNGKLYGFTRFGGATSEGVLFEFDPTTNTYAKKLDFGGTNFGSGPAGSLAISPNGKLYGGTNYGGANGRGVIFEYDPANNTFTKKLDLNSTNGAHILWQRFLFVKGEQTITFNTLPSKIMGDAPFALTATSSVALPISYTSSNTAVATISGSTVTITGAGTTIITASQAGDASYNPAPSVTQTLTVNKIDQTITFGALSARNFGDAAFALTATTTSNLPISYSSSNTAVATISGNAVTIVGAGTTIITASQAGNANYNAAVDVTQALTVNKINQTITFTAITDKTVGDAAFAISATASSTLPITFSTTSSKITISGSQVTIVSAGRATITAAQAGNTNFNAATSVDRSFCIKPAKPTIAVSNLNTETPTLTSSATSGNQWFLNGTAITGATSATYTATQAGQYTVQVRVDDCASELSNAQVLIVTGDLPTDQTTSLVYPNPATSDIVISLTAFDTQQAAAVEIHDLLGRPVHRETVRGREEVKVAIASWSTGRYLVRVQQGSRQASQSFIKTN